ncbi:MAG: dihydrofolate reductase [Flavobacteriales bacterium]|nr:dihydrofolate reductase [Flavobacteriales bacterium]
MTIYSIAAVAENGAIGKDNDLIWNLPDDMKFFKEKTLNTAVIMGRKNFESIPHKFRPLPKRVNIVLSRDKGFSAKGAYTFESIQEAIHFCEQEGYDKTFVIGGGQIYKLALDEGLIDEMFITQVHASFDGDSFYPPLNKNEWSKSVISKHLPDEKHQYAFTIEHWVKNKS